MASLVSVEWLQAHINDGNVVVVDIRGSVTSEDLGGGRQQATYAGDAEAYIEAHIPGAVFIDWTRDIVELDAEVKAQIATPESFAFEMESRGIGDDTHVISVDNTGGHIATRLWWALRYMGHDKVSVLDGGHDAWLTADGEVTRDIPSVRPNARFTPNPQPELSSDWQKVLEIVQQGGPQLVDARDADTFDGNIQRGSRGGHIPGSINLPAKSMMNDDGTWKSEDEIRHLAIDAGVDLNQPIVAYCNGGVTATQAMFGLQRAGANRLSNYDGSWNEWGEREDLPVEANRDLFATGAKS